MSDSRCPEHMRKVIDAMRQHRVQLYTEDQLAAAKAAAFRRGQERMIKRAAHICAMVEPETKPGNAGEAVILHIGFTEGRKLCERAIRALPVEEERK